MFNFSKKLRLSKIDDFRLVFKKKRKISFKEFVIFWIENQFLHPRIGIFLKKNIIKKAYQRNRIKRLIREVFRLNNKKILFLDFVILVKKEIVYLKNNEINDQLRILFNNFLKKI